MSEVTKNPIEAIKEEPEQIAPAVKPAIAPRPARRYRAWLFQLYVIAAVIAFAVLTFFAHDYQYFNIDLQITRSIQTINNFAFDAAMRYLTVLGFTPQVTLIWALTVLLLYVTGLKWESVMTLFSVVGAGALGSGIKLLVARPRPDAVLIHVFQPIGEYGFPSGHVLFYVSLGGFLWFLCYTLLKPSWRRTLALCAFGLTIALVGVSRVYLGQHWASDVIGAYLLGSIWLALTIAVYRWGKPRFFVTQPVAAEKPNATVA